MINLDEIDKAILELEQHDTSYAACEKLAWLYIVKDHNTGLRQVSHETVSQQAGSEFLEVCSGVDVDALLNILDDHMQAISLLYPREYSVIISKIKALKT